MAPFMTKELCKAIWNKSRLRKKIVTYQLKKIKNYTWIKEIRVSQSTEKSIRNYFHKIAKGNIVQNSNFWKIIKPFLTNKGHLEND